jgi:hypothetical protein
VIKSVFRVMQTVDVLRDTVTSDRDDYGDETETDASAVLLSDVLVAIVQSMQQVPTSDGNLRAVRVVTGWADVSTGIQSGDRLRTADGSIYAVDNAVYPVQLGLLDVRLELTRTS